MAREILRSSFIKENIPLGSSSHIVGRKRNDSNGLCTFSSFLPAHIPDDYVCAVGGRKRYPGSVVDVAVSTGLPPCLLQWDCGRAQVNLLRTDDVLWWEFQEQRYHTGGASSAGQDQQRPDNAARVQAALHPDWFTCERIENNFICSVAVLSTCVLVFSDKILATL